MSTVDRGLRDQFEILHNGTFTLECGIILLPSYHFVVPLLYSLCLPSISKRYLHRQHIVSLHSESFLSPRRVHVGTCWVSGRAAGTVSIMCLKLSSVEWGQYPDV